MFKLKTFLVKERVGVLNLVDAFDIDDPATGAAVGVAKENIGIADAMQLLLAAGLAIDTIYRDK